MRYKEEKEAKVLFQPAFLGFSHLSVWYEQYENRAMV
jgi:hypothetical protein